MVINESGSEFTQKALDDLKNYVNLNGNIYFSEKRLSGYAQKKSLIFIIWFQKVF